MANHPSAKKRNRQNIKRRQRNMSWRSRVHKAERRLREAIQNKDTASLKELLPATVSTIMSAGSKGVLHARTASRKVARLSRAVERAGSAQ